MPKNSIRKTLFVCNYVSNQKNLNESNIRKWVRFYKLYGSIGFLQEKT
jgi:transposase